MAAAAILKIRKIAISPQRQERFWWNLVQRFVWAIQILSANKILWIRQSKMLAAANLKNRKMLISSQPIDQFWQNLARWCLLTLWTPIDNKISKFTKCKISAAAILKIRKIATSLQWNDRFWQNLEKWCVWVLRLLSANKILWIWQCQMAAAAILKNHKNLDIFTTDWPILTKFGMQMCLDLFRPNSQYNFAISKIRDGGVGLFENWRKCSLHNKTTNFNDI